MIETDRSDRREAYDMGFNDSIALTTDELEAMQDRPGMGEDASQAVAENFSAYTSGARWANSLLPRLRAMAGYDDTMGTGTYSDGSQVHAERLDELVAAYRDGWVDKSLGYDRYQSRPHLAETADHEASEEGGGA